MTWRSRLVCDGCDRETSVGAEAWLTIDLTIDLRRELARAPHHSQLHACSAECASKAVAQVVGEGPEHFWPGPG